MVPNLNQAVRELPSSCEQTVFKLSDASTFTSSIISAPTGLHLLLPGSHQSSLKCTNCLVAEEVWQLRAQCLLLQSNVMLTWSLIIDKFLTSSMVWKKNRNFEAGFKTIASWIKFGLLWLKDPVFHTSSVQIVEYIWWQWSECAGEALNWIDTRAALWVLWIEVGRISTIVKLLWNCLSRWSLGGI